MRRFAAIASMAAISLAMLVSCVKPKDTAVTPQGIQWVLTAAEFEALCLQAYRAASEFLQPALDDRNWSALPDQASAGDLPPAIIFDVDETVLSNARFQATYTPPFTNSKLDDWSREGIADPIPGAVDFAKLARDAGVELFFVTNRPCEKKPGVDDPCPQEAVTLQDLLEAGIDTDAEHLLLANERPGWDREKVVRRNVIAKTHRVIMLLGDDLSDFIACVRSSPRKPCTEAATADTRQAAVYDYRQYWGAGWFVLPNPMHGSWTSVE
jgi:5'-nucleotidase (lipoprotein e(P4) family)